LTSSIDGCQRIYSRLELCPALEPSAPWQRVPCHPAFRLWRPNLLDELRSQFADEDLLSVGVLARDGETGAVLAECLQAETAILPIRKAPDQLPAQLVVGHRVFPQGADACLALLNDYRLGELVGGGRGATFIVGSLPELAVLWSCGLPGTIAPGLESLTVQGLRWLSQRVDELAYVGQRQRDAASAATEWDDESDDNDEQMDDAADANNDAWTPIRPAIALANWSLFQLEPAPQPWVGPLHDHLESADRHCQALDVEHGIWTPDAETFKRLNYCLRFGELADIVEALVDSSYYLESHLPDQIDSGRELAPLDYPEAYCRWLTSIQRGHGEETVHYYWTALKEAQERQLIAPLLALSAASADPLTSNRLVLLAHLLRQVYRSLNHYAEGQAKGGAANVSLLAASRSDELKRVLGVYAEINKLMKEIISCQFTLPRRRLS